MWNTLLLMGHSLISYKHCSALCDPGHDKDMPHIAPMTEIYLIHISENELCMNTVALKVVIEIIENSS